MNYLYLKAIHIIFVVTWFSGMFYIVRLFIYNREAQDKPEAEKAILSAQLNIMISRLYWAITFPSAILTFIFGGWLASIFWPFDTWLWLKLAFVALLYAYQYSLHRIFKQQSQGIFKHSSNQLRLWNEVPTVILVAVVMLVVVKQSMSLFYGITGLLGLILTLMIAIRLYKSIRGK